MNAYQVSSVDVGIGVPTYSCLRVVRAFGSARVRSGNEAPESGPNAPVPHGSNSHFINLAGGPQIVWMRLEPDKDVGTMVASEAVNGKCRSIQISM